MQCFWSPSTLDFKNVHQTIRNSFTQFTTLYFVDVDMLKGFSTLKGNLFISLGLNVSKQKKRHRWLEFAQYEFERIPDIETSYFVDMFMVNVPVLLCFVSNRRKYAFCFVT